MKRVNTSKRIPLAKLEAAADKIYRNRQKADRDIAIELEMARRTVNAIRHCCIDTPALFERVLTGDISLSEATRLGKTALNGTTSKGEDTVSESRVVKLGTELQAWCELTRQLIDSIERTFANFANPKK